MNLSMKQKSLTDIENRLVVAKRDEEWWRVGVGVWG